MKLAALLVLASILTSVIAADQPQPSEPITHLDAFRVHEDPINSFGFDLRILHDRKTHKITHIFFGEIKEGSSAAELDIKPGDQITKINGKPVTEFNAGASVETELGKLLLSRHPGETLDLEIVRHRRATVTVKAVPVPLLRH